MAAKTKKSKEAYDPRLANIGLGRKKTTQGGKAFKTSSLNKHKKTNYQKYRGQGR